MHAFSIWLGFRGLWSNRSKLSIRFYIVKIDWVSLKHDFYNLLATKACEKKQSLVFPRLILKTIEAQPQENDISCPIMTASMIFFFYSFPSHIDITVELSPTKIFFIRIRSAAVQPTREVSVRSLVAPPVLDSRPRRHQLQPVLQRASNPWSPPQERRGQAFLRSRMGWRWRGVWLVF